MGPHQTSACPLRLSTPGLCHLFRFVGSSSNAACTSRLAFDMPCCCCCWCCFKWPYDLLLLLVACIGLLFCYNRRRGGGDKASPLITSVIGTPIQVLSPVVAAPSAPVV